MRSEKVLEQHDMLSARRVLAATAIFGGAFLLFMVEPLFAKRILPWFGGSAAVWSTCLVFYQTALSGGLFICPRFVALCEFACASGWCMWRSCCWRLSFCRLARLTDGSPPWVRSRLGRFLSCWARRSGLPFVVSFRHESAGAVLAGAQLESRLPYRLFALSNFASLAALLGYPILIEPRLDIAAQRFWWSVGFAGFVLACGAFACFEPRRFRGGVWKKPEPLPVFRRLYWFSLSAVGSMLLLICYQSHHAERCSGAVAMGVAAGHLSC